MRCILFFIAISLFSCAGLQKHPKPSKAAYGGAFGLGQSSILLTLIFIFIRWNLYLY